MNLNQIPGRPDDINPGVNYSSSSEEPSKQQPATMPNTDALIKQQKEAASREALSKIKMGSIPVANQTRFIPQSSNVGVMMIRREDGTQVVDSFKPFTFFRDTKTGVAWAIFRDPKPRTRLITKIPLIGGLESFYITQEKIFNTELAVTTLTGWMSCFDAGTMQQIPFTQNKDVVALYHKLDRELNSTIQGLILANMENERQKKRGTFWEKYGANIMLFIAIMMLALAIYQNGSDIAGLKTSIGNLGSQISSLSGLIPKITGGLPAT